MPVKKSKTNSTVVDVDVVKGTVFVIGRWQPFHKGHLSLVRRAIETYGNITLGVGSSNKGHTWENPFTFAERINMISACLEEEGLSNRVRFVPIPDVGDDKVWFRLIEELVSDIGLVITGNAWCERIFSNAGYRVIHPDFLRKEFYNGTLIREDMRLQGLSQVWKKKVPEAIVRIIEGIPNLDGRLARVHNHGDGRHGKGKTHKTCG